MDTKITSKLQVISFIKKIIFFISSLLGFNNFPYTYVSRHMILTNEGCLYSIQISQVTKTYKLILHNFLLNWEKLNLWKLEPQLS